MTPELKEAKKAYKNELTRPVSHKLNRNVIVIEPMLRYSKFKHSLFSNCKLIVV